MATPTMPARRGAGSPSRPNAVIGQRYELLREVGAGSFGTVYQARHVQTLRVVALKVLHEHVADDEGARERFRREVQAPARIGHPGIVEVLDASVDDDGQPFVAMRWLEGETLRLHLQQGAPPLARVLELFEQLLEALSAAHQAGIVHRDLKPDNVFVERSEAGPAVRILDFGLAREQTATSITATGTALGTPRYMSPEQFMNAKAAGPTSDVWAVGAMLYEALSGEPPFRDRSSHVLMLKVLTTPPAPLLDLAPHVPAELATLVERCLAKEPEGRPADAGALLTQLRALREVLSPSGGLPSTTAGRDGAPTAPAWRPRAEPLPSSPFAPEPTTQEPLAASAPLPAPLPPAAPALAPLPAQPALPPTRPAAHAHPRSPSAAENRPRERPPAMPAPLRAPAEPAAAVHRPRRAGWLVLAALAALALLGTSLALGLTYPRWASRSERVAPAPAAPLPEPLAPAGPDALMRPEPAAPLGAGQLMRPVEPEPAALGSGPPMRPIAPAPAASAPAPSPAPRAAPAPAAPAPAASAPAPSPAPRAAPTRRTPAPPPTPSLPVPLPRGIEGLDPRRLPMP